MDLLLLAIAPAWFFVTWKRPHLGFILLPFFLPLYVLRTHIGPIPTTALELAIIGLVIGWLAARGASGLQTIWQRLVPWRIPLALWLGAGTLGVITSAVNGFDVLAALGLFRAYFIKPLLLFVIGFDLLHENKHRTKLFLSFTAVALLLTVYAVVQYITGWGIPHPWDAWPGRRATGPFPFPNALALFLVPLGAFAATRLIDRSKERLPAILLFGATLVASALAESDGGVIALGAALIVVLLFKKQTRIPTLIISAVLIATAFSITPIREKILFQEWSGKVRLIIWQETGDLLHDNVVLGAGLAAYPQAIVPYHRATWMEVFQYPHNILLNLWSELGLLGIIAFIAILLTWLRQSRKEIAIPIVLAILVHGLVDVPYFKNDLAILFWLLVLLTITHTPQSPRKTA